MNLINTKYAVNFNLYHCLVIECVVFLVAYIKDSKPEKGGKGEVSLVSMNKVDPDQNGVVTQNGKVPEEGGENGEKKKEEVKMVPPMSVVRFHVFDGS